jgi:hypothetical protein
MRQLFDIVDFDNIDHEGNGAWCKKVRMNEADASLRSNHHAAQLPARSDAETSEFHAKFSTLQRPKQRLATIMLQKRTTRRTALPRRVAENQPREFSQLRGLLD